MSKRLVFPPPIPADRLSAHARRAARAFERVHETLTATATGGRTTAKKPRRVGIRPGMVVRVP